MKKNHLRKLLYLMGVLVLASMVMIACKKDEDEEEPPILVEDGFYIKGEVTPFEKLDIKGTLEAGINEVGQEARTGMYEKYITIKKGDAGFNIVQVAGKTLTNWGPANVQEVATNGENEQPDITIQTGDLGTSGVFKINADGLYHVIIDIQSKKFVIAPVPYWAIIGGATEAGWSDTPMDLVGGFNLEKMTWKGEGIVLRTGDFKFRYGGGWKLEIVGDEVKANTNYGGEVSGTLPNLITTLVPGGPNYALNKDQEGVYTIQMEWTLNDGYKASLTKTEDVVPLDYPEELFMIGDGVGDWDWNNTDLPMIPVHSHTNLFWKIVWMNAEGGFKFAPQKEWGGDFGKTGDGNNGIYAKGGDNIPVPGEAGYYMVVVNFETEQIAIVDPQVYLMGQAIGGWDTADPEGLFNVDNDNEVITMTKTLNAASANDGGLRMYAWFTAADWMSDWWQSEFIILDNKIEFRGKGDDQERVEISAGTYKIDLNFKTGAGSITAQ